jgi:rubrerythrin
MLSSLPVDLNRVKKEDVDREILRAGMIAELDAVNFYEQMAAKANNKHVKELLLDIAREEKTHIAEFETMLLALDKEQVKENVKGKTEALEIMGKK